jgi:hypothetical protein
MLPMPLKFAAGLPPGGLRFGGHHAAGGGIALRPQIRGRLMGFAPAAGLS